MGSESEQRYAQEAHIRIRNNYDAGIWSAMKAQGRHRAVPDENDQGYMNEVEGQATKQMFDTGF